MKTPSSPSLRGDQLSAPSSPKDEKEKTIPFLRQLTEMLQNNEELISFVPGRRLPHEIIQGKIIVHDRNRVQSEVLPIYFNHASFASLRRQLSYFSFVRVGKSRQSGVTYTNDGVVDLIDILKLKRRTAGQAGGAIKHQLKRQKKHQQPSSQAQAQSTEKHQELQHQQQQERQLTTTSVDVASAVLSGTLHAAKTNHNLDINNSSNINSPTASRTSPVQPVCHTSSSNTQSSISNSLSRSSSSSSDNASNNKDGSRNNNTNINNNERSISKPSSSNSKALKRKAPSFPKHRIPRKDRARLDRLLSINNIVPFIHLPAGHTMGPRKEGSISHVTNTASDAVGCMTNITMGERAFVHQKENKLLKVDTARERGLSTDGTGAIHALLALGADRQ